MLDKFQDELNTLTEQEKNVVFQILNEYSKKGTSEQLQSLLYEDYEEIPVDIDTFLDDPEYLGQGLVNEEGKKTVFPYWRETLRKIFPDNLTVNYNTVALTGSIGIGKSFIAVICILYLLYRMLCLKDPYLHYGLQPIDKITFGFMNITLDASKGVAWDKCQQLLQVSPWFMKHGTVSGTVNVEWKPPKGVELIAGSLPRHIIGRAVFACLDGDTEILTNFGDKKLKDLVNKSFKVMTVVPDGTLSYSDWCTVKPTAFQNEEYEIVLDDDTIIKCTPNHKLLLSNGVYKEAQYLTESDDIFYAQPNKSNYISYINNILSTRGRFIYDNVYKERHHIIPKCCNGTDELSNLVDLLPEEHYTAHYLLAKENPENYKLGHALNCMLTLNKCYDYVIDANTYKNARILASAALKIATTGEHNPMFGKVPWNKGLTKDMDCRIELSAEKCSKTKLGVSKGPDSEKTRERKRQAIKLRYKLHPETFKLANNAGKRIVTNGKSILFIPATDDPPIGYWYGNCFTQGVHNMQKYYSNPELQKHRSEINSGIHNPNYRHGERQAGGKNGKALYDYWFEDKYFECRKYLLEYLNNNNFKISENALRNIQNGTYGKTTLNKFAYVIDNLRWRLKNEN